jgi:hypothetical protein
MSNDATKDNEWLHPRQAMLMFLNREVWEPYLKAEEKLRDFVKKSGYSIGFFIDPKNPMWRPYKLGFSTDQKFDMDGFDDGDLECIYEERNDMLQMFNLYNNERAKTKKYVEDQLIINLINENIRAIGTTYSSATEAEPQRCLIDSRRWKNELRLDFVNATAVLRIDSKIAFIDIQVGRHPGQVDRKDGVYPLQGETFAVWLEFLIKSGRVKGSVPGGDGPWSRDRWCVFALKCFGNSVLSKSRFESEWTRLANIYDQQLSKPGRRPTAV